jgi:hypothetical protein
VRPTGFTSIIITARLVLQTRPNNRIKTNNSYYITISGCSTKHCSLHLSWDLLQGQLQAFWIFNGSLISCSTKKTTSSNPPSSTLCKYISTLEIASNPLQDPFHIWPQAHEFLVDPLLQFKCIWTTWCMLTAFSSGSPLHHRAHSIASAPSPKHSRLPS